MKTVIGLFDAASDAYSAQNELVAAGVTRDRISVVTSESNRDLRSNKSDTTDTADTTRTTDKTEAAEGAGVGATAGALAGGAAGILASLGLLAIPGIGGLLALGPIVAALTGAGIGAAAGGLIGGLIGLGIPEHEAEVYAEGINRGGTLVTVDAADTDADRVASILSQHNAIDIDQRASEWESSGWKRQHPASTSTTTTTTTSSVDARTRGIDRPGSDMGASGTTGSMDPATSGIGSTRRTTSARIYNPR